MSIPEIIITAPVLADSYTTGSRFTKVRCDLKRAAIIKKNINIPLKVSKAKSLQLKASMSNIKIIRE